MGLGGLQSTLLLWWMKVKMFVKNEQTCNRELILASVRGSARGVFASHYSRWVGHGLSISQHQANTHVSVI